MQFLLKYLGLILLSLAVFSCARQDNPTPQAQVYRFQDNPQVVSVYKVGATDTLISRESFRYLPDGKVDTKTIEYYRSYGRVHPGITIQERNRYDGMGNLETKEVFSIAPGVEVLSAWSKARYTSSGKFLGIRTESIFPNRTVFVINVSYNSDGSVEWEYKDSTAYKSTYNRTKVLINTKGKDSVFMFLDTLNTPPVWRKAGDYTYDNLGRVVSQNIISSTINGPLFVFSDYQPCKIPAAIYQNNFLFLSGTMNQELFNFYTVAGYSAANRGYYFTSDPEYLSGVVSYFSSALPVMVIDNSAGPGLELNSAGYLKILKYKASSSLGTMQDSYKMVLDY